VSGGRRVLAANEEAIMRPEDVSYGFNARLRKVFRYSEEESEWLERYVKLSLNMYSWPNAPRTALILDVDARAAIEAGSSPHLIAPPNEPIEPGSPEETSIGYQPGLSSSGLIYGRKWFPSQRHQGKTNVALLDGSVRSIKDLLAESERINWIDAEYPGRWINGSYELPPGVESSEMTDTLWSESSLDCDEVH